MQETFEIAGYTFHFVSLFVCRLVWVHVWGFAYVCACVCVCLCVYLSVSVCVYLCLCVSVCVWVYRDWETDRKSTRLNSSHLKLHRMPSSA